MRTRTRVAEESADLVRRLGRQNVLELACLLLDFGFAVESERIGEQPLGKAMAPDDISRSLSSPFSKFHQNAAITGRDSRRLQRIMARIHEWPMIVRLGRMWARGDQPHLCHRFYCEADRQRAVDFHAIDLG